MLLSEHRDGPVIKSLHLVEETTTPNLQISQKATEKKVTDKNTKATDQ